MARKNISKKTRFEVFKRDNFTCQYCGRSAPSVVLEIDHIKPVSKGGDNDIMNLITSCFDCNRGKGKRKLTDNSEIKVQMEQLKQINKQREQLEMLLAWKKELQKFEDEQIDKIEELFKEKTWHTFSDMGRTNCAKWLKEYGFEEVYESMRISLAQYYDETDGDSIEKVFDYTGKICYTRQRQKSHPLEHKINYLCKIGRNRLTYFDNNYIRAFLRIHFELTDFSNLKEMFTTAKNWSTLIDWLSEYYGEEL